MKAITIDFTLVAESMRDLVRARHDYYLDRTTARVISVSRELIGSLTYEGADERPEVPEWDARLIPLAREIILEGSKNYVRIPEAFGYPEREWRVAFAEKISDADLKEKLILALRGRGSVRRFKTILKEKPEEWKKWETFCSEAWKQKVCAWLEEIGLLGFDQKLVSPNKKAS